MRTRLCIQESTVTHYLVAIKMSFDFHMKNSSDAWRKYLYSRQVADVNESIVHAQKALEIKPIDPVQYYNICADLGSRLIVKWVKFSLHRAEVNVQKAQEMLQNVFQNGPPELINIRIAHLHNIVVSVGMLLQNDDQYMENILSLRLFVQATQEILKKFQGSRLLTEVLFFESCRAYYKITFEQETISMAFEMAYSDSLDNWVAKAEMPICQSSLGALLRARYEHTGAAEDLNRAKDLTRRALESCPNNQTISFDMACILKYCYKTTGDVGHLQEGIRRLEEIINNSNEEHLLSDSKGALSSFFYLQFERSGMMNDLDRGIELAESLGSPKDANTEATRLNNLSMLWARKYEHTSNMQFLDTAIQLSETALDKAPSHPLLHQHLNSLAIWLSWRYEASGNIEKSDLDRAIENAEMAIQKCTSPRIDLASYRSNLCNFLGQRYLYSRCVSDVDRAIREGELSKKISMQSSIDYLRAVRNLGENLARRNSAEDINNAIKMWNEAIGTTYFPPIYRANLAAEATRILKIHKKYNPALDIAKLGLGLLTKASPRFMKGSDQQRILRRYSGLASDTAALTIECGGSEADAVSLLEQGRSILADHQYESRQDLSELKAVHPDQATHFENLLDRLNDLPKMPDLHYSMAEELQGINGELDAVIESIRNQQGFERFLLSPDINHIYDVIKGGADAIVIVNASFRYDSFVIRDGSISVVPLPHVSDAVVRNWTNRWNGHFARERYGVLEDLWTNVALPIVTHLGLEPVTHTDDSMWPRIYWIPTGPLTNLPLHAAGYYRDKRHHGIPDCAVSSYNISLKAMVRLHQNRERSDTRMSVEHGLESSKFRQTALLVPMPVTPGLNELPAATVEVDKIRAALESKYEPFLPCPVSRQIVLQKLAQAHIFHFAGHCSLDYADVLQSSLMLTDGNLTISDLLTLRKSQSPLWLAYLSACSTGVNAVRDLADEGLHLMGACQIVGWQNVTGTLWRVADEFSMRIALEFYTILGNDYSRNVALALHQAVRQNRGLQHPGPDNLGARDGKWISSKSSGLTDPWQWAAYIHMGI
ncbi:CHAT domain-containing protein [Trichoderma sp. TUCIM 5745]